MSDFNFDNINISGYECSKKIPSYMLRKFGYFILDRYPLDKYKNIFEPGIGTGRIAIPIAKLGYDVSGSDISNKMLLKLRKICKLKELNIDARLENVSKLSKESDSIDLVIVAHLFHLIKDIPQVLKEISRILRKDGELLSINTGTGTIIPEINQLYKKKCKEYGVSILNNPYSLEDVHISLIENGFFQVGEIEIGTWVKEIRIEHSLKQIRTRVFSFTTFAPDKVHSQIIKEIENELLSKYDNIQKKIKVINSFRVNQYKRIK